MKIELAQRVNELPAYIFSQINAIKAEAAKKGVSLMSLAIGDPDQPTPPALVKKFQQAAEKPANHLYSPYDGTPQFRTAAAKWMKKRFGVELDADKEVIALIGSKEGIAHLPLALCNPGDRALYPDPGYPIFETSILLAGGTPIAIPHRLENRFLPDLAELEKLMKTHTPKFMILNYPSNPTTATCSLEVLTEIVRLAKKHNVVIAYDNAYSEIYFNDNEKPISILQIEGAKDVAIEFHSLSKSYNMTGWRIAFAVGNETLVKGLLKLKTNIDSGPLLSVQETGAYALENSEELTSHVRNIYRERRERTLEGLRRLNIEYFPPQATFFVWARVPTGQTSMDFVKSLIETEGLVLTPGIGFGKQGEHFFRLALTVPPSQIDEAFRRLEKYLSKK